MIIFRRFWTDDKGATAIEYGLIASLIFLAIIAAVNLLSDEMTDMYNFISNTVANAV
jgi:pilus assembly protein Flp/PilA